jgi:hypothetical protein
MQSQKRGVSRVLLVVFTIWALAMIVPDLYRLVHPLGSFGFYANNDGLVTHVKGPFQDETASPAFQAGLRAGDRLDLAQMRCIPLQTLKCASNDKLDAPVIADEPQASQGRHGGDLVEQENRQNPLAERALIGDDVHLSRRPFQGCGTSSP